jgi:hypothetical protein
MTQSQARRKSSQPGAGYFALSELKRLNCGYYHDSCHALEVANLVRTLARAYGRSEVRAEFLKQVALVHDADPRTCPKTGNPREGTPARVQVTLSWMEQERAHLEKRFGWRGDQFNEASALIARSDYPFDDNPRNYGTRFDGMSPQDVYRETLSRLPDETRRRCMVDALLLRFADQVAAYVGSFQRARDSVQDLVDELNNTGLSLTFESTFKQTPNFLNQIGRDLTFDQQLKSEFYQNDLTLPRRNALLALLGWKKRIKFTRNLLKFKFS